MKKTNKINLISGIVIVAIIVIAIGVHSYNAHRLSGTYSGDVSFLIFSSKDYITFSKDKTFTEGEMGKNGKRVNPGTYEINGDQLKLHWKKSDVDATCKLAKDHKSFVIKKATGLSGMSDGTKFTKKN